MSSLTGRYVFDTNVLVSALLFSTGTPGRALLQALEHGTVLVTAATLAELAEVTARPKFDRYLSPADRDDFVAALARRAEIVEVENRIVACRDPKDDKFLEAAVSGRATAIVTGDQDLLVLHPFQGIAILPPATFLQTLDS